MSTMTDDALVGAVARDAIAVAAPQELPLFRAASRRYFDDPDVVERPRDGKDEVLGFGVETAAILLTPVALCVAKTVVSFVATEVARVTKEESRAVIQNRVRRLFRRGNGDGAADDAGEEADDVEALSDDQLVEVRRVAVEKATVLGLAPDKAQILADAVVGTLATADA
jgi:hypothetical protein